MAILLQRIKTGGWARVLRWLVVAAGMGVATSGLAHEGIQLLSISTEGLQDSGISTDPAISGDGSVVAFRSSADDLVPDDTNSDQDLFLRDTNTGTTIRINVAADGTESPSEGSPRVALSENGDFVAFESSFDGLVEGDTNGLEDCFLWDRRSGSVERINVALNGEQPNGTCQDPDISADGIKVAFRSSADNLVEGDTNGRPDIFVYDRISGNVTRVNVDDTGAQSTSGSADKFDLSANGRFLAFEGGSYDVVRIGTPSDEVFADACNRGTDPMLLVRDLQEGTTQALAFGFDFGTSISYSTQMRADRMAISPDGRHIVYESQTLPVDLGTETYDDVQIILHDRDAAVDDDECGRIGSFTLISQFGGEAGDADSTFPSVSLGASKITFLSSAQNLTNLDDPPTRGVYFWDSTIAAPALLSVNAQGEPGGSISFFPRVTDDGEWAVFASNASNLVADDTNGSRTDIFRTRLVPRSAPVQPVEEEPSIFTRVVDTSDTVPGRAETFNKFDPPVFDGSKVAVKGYYGSKVPVIVTGSGNLDLQAIATRGDSVPGRAGGTFENFSRPSIRSGVVSFSGSTLERLFNGTYHTRNGSLREVVDEFDLEPEDNVALQFFSTGTSNMVGSAIAFRASTNLRTMGTYLGVRNGVLRLLRAGTTLPTTLGETVVGAFLADPAADDGSGIVAQKINAGSGGDGIYIIVPFGDGDESEILPVANAFDSVPGEIIGTAFGSFQNEVVIDDNHILFIGSWRDGDEFKRGLFVYVPGIGVVRVKLDTVTEDFDQLRFDLDDGNLAILERTGTEQRLYLATRALSQLQAPVTRLQPRLIIGTGDELEGFEVTNLRFGAGGLQGAAMAFSSTNEVGTSAVYIARPEVDPDTGSNNQLAASVLPTSRSAKVGQPVTVFATIINTGSQPAEGCTLGTNTDAPLLFRFQQTDAATNAPIGEENEAISLAPGAAQSYVVTFTPAAVFDSTDVALEFDCLNGPAALSVTGLNTVRMSAADGPVADVIALAATPSGDGIINIPTNPGLSGVGAVSSVNVGDAGITGGTVEVDTGAASLPVNVFVCPTDPGTGACTEGLAPVASISIAPGAQPTFAIFVQNTSVDGEVQVVPFDPANNRAFLRFVSADGVVRGSTSVAIRTE